MSYANNECEISKPLCSGDSSLRIGMTKQRFVIGEFISVTMNEPMLFCFVIGEFCSNRNIVAITL